MICRLSHIFCTADTTKKQDTIFVFKDLIEFWKMDSSLRTMIKIRKPKVQQRLPREQGINNGHKVSRQSISQERGSRLSSFVLRRMFTEGDSSLSHPMTSVLAAACHSTGFWQKLIRNRGLMRNSM